MDVARLRWPARLRPPGADDLAGLGGDDLALAMRVQLLLYAAASVLALVGTLGRWATGEPAQSAAIGTAACTAMTIVLLIAPRHRAVMHGILVLGTANTCMAVATSPGGATNAVHFYLLWTVVFASVFCGVRALVAHSALVAGGLALVFALGPQVQDALGQWLLLVGSFLAVGLLMRTLCRQLAQLRRREAELARRDDLTGLPNRRAFVEAAGMELARADRAGLAVAVVLLDLDRFKALNDRGGHAGGDEALRRTGAALRGEARAGELVARWGGEEFTVLLGGVTEDDARRAAERLRTAIAAATADAGVAVTASAGVAVGDPAGGLDALLAQADAALYAAKRDGRDRVRAASALAAA